MKLWRQIRQYHYQAKSTDIKKDNSGSVSPATSTDSGQQSGVESRSQSPCEEFLGVSIVELMKPEGDSLGIIISQGGGNKSQLCPSISSLRTGSVAQRSDSLAPGDRLTAVNGVRTDTLRRQELIALLKNVEERAVLEVEYPLPPYRAEGTAVVSKVTQVVLEREVGSLGFTLRGGVNPDPLLTRPLTITHVRPGGPADKEGTIKAGDRLLAFNGTYLQSVTLFDAQRVLQDTPHAQQLCTLSIEYDVSVLESVRHATGPLLVEIERPPVSELGITLADAEGKGSWISQGSQDGEVSSCVVIESIKPAGIAERCGALHVGDQLLAVDETRIEGTTMTAAHVTNLLNSRHRGHVTLEILPLSQINCGWRISDDSARSRGFLGYPSSSSPSPLEFGTLNSRRRKNIARNRTKLDNSNPTMFHNDSGSISGGNFGCPGVYHTESLHIPLQPDQQGYGLTVQSCPDSNAIVIASIDHGGPADRCGCLQVGDRILSANHRSVCGDGMTADDVTQLLTNQDVSRVALDVEFDVADSVVPSSGVFSVKLAKRGNGLGITITASKNRLPGEPLLISDIRRGSIAHRTGTLQPGDRLLAIDSLQIDQCSIQDTQHILHNSADIVTLRVQKDDALSEVSDTNSVVYTVELVRYGGPLGVTLSGSEERFEPIKISGLTPGGLAEQTGALHIGDRLLAINGDSLRGKPLSSAISMLHNSGDSVTLKIARSRLKLSASPTDVDHYTPGLSSVDSAIESWGDHPPGDTSPVAAHPPLALPVEVYKSESATVRRRMKHGVEATPEGGDVRWPPDSFVSIDSGQEGVLTEEEKITWETLRNGEMDEAAISPISECSDFSSENPLYDVDIQDLPSPPRDYFDDVPTAVSTAPSPLPLPPYLRNHTLPNRRRYSEMQGKEAPVQEAPTYEDIYIGESRGYNNTHCGSYMNLALNSSNSNQRVELYQVTLFKDAVYEDFGFSVSDGLYERGVYVNRVRKGGPADMSVTLKPFDRILQGAMHTTYVNRVRKGGPADMSVTLKPFDRILQVNDTRTHDFDCCLTVPLIASAGDKLELTIARNLNSYTTFQEHKDSTGKTMNWVEEDGSSTVTNSHSTITKTL